MSRTQEPHLHVWMAPAQGSAQAWEWLHRCLPQTLHGDSQAVTLHAGRNRLIRCSSPWGQVVIKSFAIPRKARAMMYQYRSSKALRSFINALVLARQGFPTPQAYACIEERDDGALQRSWYICASIEPAVELRALRKSPNASMLGYWQQAGALLAGMHRARIHHRDFSPGNILLHHGQLSVVDINRISYRRHSMLSEALTLGRMYVTGPARVAYTQGYAAARKRSWRSVYYASVAFTAYLRGTRSLKRFMRGIRRS